MSGRPLLPAHIALLRRAAQQPRASALEPATGAESDHVGRAHLLGRRAEARVRAGGHRGHELVLRAAL